MTTKNYGAIADLTALDKLVQKLSASDTPLGFDIETGYDGPDRAKASLFPHTGAYIVGFSITDSPSWARYIPLAHQFAANLPADEVWKRMRPLLESPRIVCHNAKFEKRHLRRVGIELGIIGDTMLESYCLSEWQSNALKELVLAVFNHKMTRIEELFPGLPQSRRDNIRFNQLDLTPDVVAYACEDAAWTLALHEKLEPRVLAQRKSIYTLEMGIMEILCDMEDAGVAVDWEGMARARAKAEPFLAKMEAEVKAELGAKAGRSLVAMNLGSAKQMRELLYEEMGLSTTRTTKAGELSTDGVAMAKLAKDIPEIRKLLQLREVENLAKRMDLWLEADKKKGPVKGLDGRVHAGYGQTVVGTGRFAANDPPIQQCPKDWRWELTNGDVFEGNFRDFIIAAPGHYLLGFDYSQIELRVMAGLSQEPALMDAFNNDKDVHTITAAMMLGKRPEDVDLKTERHIGKTMNFALLYGMGAQSLGERLAISRERANELYASYFSGFPSITSWMEKMKREGKVRGYTESRFGRRYTVWELKSSNKAIYAKGERVLVNAPVQGGAADYMKVAMSRCAKVLKANGWWGSKVKMVMNQHDALTFEVSNDLAPSEVMALLRPAVEFAVPGFPKIVSEWEMGQRWGSCVSVKDGSEAKKVGDGWMVEGMVRKDDDLPETLPIAEVLDVEPAPYTPLPALEEVVPGRTVIVEIEQMPTQEQLARFMALLTPGQNVVMLRTPEGEMEVGQFTLDLPDGPRVSLALGGARILYPPEEVDVSSIEISL